MTTPSTEKTKESKDRATAVEDGPSLAINDPDAGYTTPDLSFHEGVGKLPPEEEEWHEKRNSLHDERVKAMEEGEKKVAEERQKEAEEAEKEQRGAKK